jgi:hypothetical protein
LGTGFTNASYAISVGNGKARRTIPGLALLEYIAGITVEDVTGMLNGGEELPAVQERRLRCVEKVGPIWTRAKQEILS